MLSAVIVSSGLASWSSLEVSSDDVVSVQAAASGEKPRLGCVVTSAVGRAL